MLETKLNKNKVELIKSGQGNIFSYFLSLKNYNRILKYLTDMKGLTPNEQRDLFEFLAFNLIGRTVMRDIRKLEKVLFSVCLKNENFCSQKAS